MTISDKGLAFIARHEGFVSRAYRDPVGVLTIGYGFTMGSRIFRDWWTTRHGRSLRLGDSLSRADANSLLRFLIEAEYGPAVAAVFPRQRQHERDACISVVYNLGPRALTWRWAQALRSGEIAVAARALERTGTTAKGKSLPGLIRRRREESALLESANYGSAETDVPALDGLEAADHDRAASPEPDAAMAWLQKTLASLGYACGPADGRFGPRTQAALRRFQQANPPLLIDGIPGPATRAALKRRVAARQNQLSGLGTAAAILTLAGPADWPPLIVLLVVVGSLAAFLAAGFLWRNRGRIAAWFA